LIALVGPSTRLARYFNGLPKEYRTLFRFGVQTDTDDCTGQTTETCQPPDPEIIRTLIPSYTGTFSQVPPRFSAVHINGRRAYEIARSGGDPDVPRRTVTVNRFDVTSVTADSLEATIECSAGTYIRSIARDIGAEAGSCAHVEELRRTAVGPVPVSDAVSPESFSVECDLRNPLDYLLLIPNMGSLEIEEGAVSDVQHGRVPDVIRSSVESFSDHPIVVYSHDTLLAVGRWTSSRWSYDLVMPRASD
jgi:tRNA pseudouridine55 synthase